MNIVNLVGRLTRDPYVQENGDKQIAKFTLACDRMKEGADYPNCVAWGKTAEIIGKYLKKGSQVAIEGQIRTGSYQKDGETIYTTDIAVSRVEFLGSKEEKPAEDKQADFEAIDEDVPF